MSDRDRLLNHAARAAVTRTVPESQDVMATSSIEQNAAFKDYIQAIRDAGPVQSDPRTICYTETYLHLVKQRTIEMEMADLGEWHMDGTIDLDLGLIHMTALKVALNMDLSALEAGAMNCKPEQVEGV